MKTSWFIAQKIIFNKQKSFSKFIIQLSIIATTISVSIMIIAISFMNGFENVIQQKAYSFWGHIRVDRFLLQEDDYKIEKNNLEYNNHISEIENNFKSNNQIDFYLRYAQKYGLILSNSTLEGVVFKGYDKNFNYQYFKSFLKKGDWLNYNKDTTLNYLNEIIISEYIANRLKLDTGNYVIVNFIEKDKTQRKRKLKIIGIYKTGIDDYDKLFAFIDLGLIQRLNNWDKNKFDGYEIFIKNIKSLNIITKNIYNKLPNNWDAKTTKDLAPNLFQWLELLHVNKWVLIIILSCIAIINIIACLLTFVIERTKMIGILKTFGFSNFSIQKIFIFYATYISMIGIIMGIVVGVLICLLQQHFKLISLDENIYFVSYAPIMIIFSQIIFILITSLIICFLILILPSYYIQKLNPIKSIQF